MIWDQAYNKTNLLDWMLSHKKGSSGGSDPDDDKDDDDNDAGKNEAPIVKAGGDKTITLPTNALDIQGSAEDRDGKISSYKWTKVSGGSASMSGTSTSKLRAYNLKAGAYTFRLTAKDNSGKTVSDDVRVQVKAAPKKEDDKPNPKNSLPTVSAGPDRVITLPTNSLDIQAKASDKDGKIVSYEWTQTYGLSNASMSGANSDKLRVYNLKKGAYIFRLRVKDNDGGTKDDFFKITVKQGSGQGNSGNGGSSGNDNSSGKTNSKPRANAGPDLVVKGKSSVTLNGSGADGDGRIVSYQWKQLAGPSASISGAKTAKPTINNLKEGRYYFSLTVKDDKNATHEDKMAINVTRK